MQIRLYENSNPVSLIHISLSRVINYNIKAHYYRNAADSCEKIALLWLGKQ